MMKTVWLAVIAISLAGTEGAPAEDPELRDQVTKLMMLGRPGEAERLAKGSSDPLVRAVWATLISEDTVQSRARGITSFDPKAAGEIATGVLPYLRKNAPSDPRCAFRLSVYYDRGLGLKEDQARSFQWCEFAAKKGDRPAMRVLALRYGDGRGVKKDAKKAFEWMKKSADGGDLCALALLGDFYADGIGVPKDPTRSRSCYEKAAKGGSVDGMFACALNELERMEKSADKGDAAALSAYVKNYQGFLRDASDLGDLGASRLLGSLYRSGLTGSVLADPDESFRHYKIAAESGLSLQLVDLACCYLIGLGCTADPARAETLFKQALEAAKREEDVKTEEKIREFLAIKNPEDREVAAEEIFDWKIGAALEDAPPAGAVAGGERLNARRDGGAEAAPAGEAARLILTDVALTPTGVQGSFLVEGRVKNVGDEPIKGLTVEVSLEDRSGKFLGTADAFITPDPLLPGRFGTFKALDLTHPATRRIKLEFSTRGGAIPWVDRSGQGVHQ